MIHDFILNFVLYDSEFWRTLDFLILDLDMICIKYISIYTVFLMASISRIPLFWEHPSQSVSTYTNLLHWFLYGIGDN